MQDSTFIPADHPLEDARLLPRRRLESSGTFQKPVVICCRERNLTPRDDAQKGVVFGPEAAYCLAEPPAVLSASPAAKGQGHGIGDP